MVVKAIKVYQFFYPAAINNVCALCWCQGYHHIVLQHTVNVTC